MSQTDDRLQTDNRQTDGRQTDGRTTTYSEREPN